jgi:pimeloyl-ACP methyl ester carboxylesterase
MIVTRRIAANGLNFAVDEAGSGDTVALCLHGFPEARQAWSEQLPALAAMGWRAAAPDLRGYGDSDRPAGREPYRLEHLIADVEALFEGLGARRRILIAHDWGGVIAWQVAIRRPGLLDGLVILNAPHPVVYRHLLDRGLKQRLRSWYVAAFQLPGLPEIGLTRNGGRLLERTLTATSPNFPPDRLALYRRNICRPGAATAMVNYYRANAAELGFGPLPTDPILAPTLLVWGENDPYLDLDLTQGNEAYVRDLSVQRLPGVSHWVQEDASPTLNGLIAAWARDKGLAGR